MLTMDNVEIRERNQQSAGEKEYNLGACGKNGFEQRTTVFEVPITVYP